MKRSGPLRRKTPMQRGGKLRPVSAKRAPWNAKYAKALAAAKAAQVAAAGGTFCEKCKATGPVEGHHTNGRLNENILTFVLICAGCHRDIHANTKAARKDGWMQ